MNAQTASGWRTILALLCFISLIETGHAAPNNAPPATETPGSDRVSPGMMLDLERSAWPTADRKDFADLLQGKHYEWLVAPTQVQKEGFDLAERSMTSAILGQALDRNGSRNPDTYVVSRALGEAKRKFSVADIDALAGSVGATTVVVPYMGHNSDSELTLTLAIYRRSTPAVPIFKVQPEFLTWENLKYSAEAPPTAIVADLLPDILRSLRISDHGAAVHSAPSHRLELPPSPEQLVSNDDDPVANAARFAVLGVLAPPRTRGSERLFEKSLLAAQRAPDGNEQAFLRAYALFRVGLRPAGMHALLGHSSHEITALNAILNGNVTGTQTLVNQTTGYARLILELALHDLAREYELDAAAPMPSLLASLTQRSAAWDTLLGIRWNSLKPWTDHDLDNVPLKQLLDHIYPVSGQALPDLVAAYQATPGQELGWSDVQLSARQHIRAYLVREQSSLCCAGMSQRPATLDLLSLIDAWSDHRIMCVVDREVRLRGIPELAATELGDIDRYYAGNPEFEVLSAHVSVALGNRFPVNERATYLAQTRDHAYRAILGAGGQTLDAIEAISIMTGDPDARLLATAYGRDYPLNPYWLGNGFVIDMRQRPALAQQALANTQTGVGYIDVLTADGTDSAKAEGIRALHNRFLGSPYRQVVQDKLIPPRMAPEATLARLRAGVRKDPTNWYTHLGLGAFLVAQGDYSGALQAYTSFPGFSENAPIDPISLANGANEAGDMLYWHGATREARQMYLIATRYKVGCETEMEAAMQLRLIDGDLQGALEAAERRAERYPNDMSYGNFLSLLHTLGRSSDAWKSFNLLVTRPSGPGLWESAMVGLRARATTPADLERWFATPEIAQANKPFLPWSNGFLIIWTTTDRDVGADLAEQTHRLGYEPRGRIQGDGRAAFYPSFQEGSSFLVQRSAFRADQRPILKDQAPVDSETYFLAQALVALQNKDYAAAVSRFDEIAAHYLIEKYVTGADAAYVLPEFAYASAKAGDPLRLETFVTSVPDDQQIFETVLSQAYFQALRHHDAPSALRYLQKAFRIMDHYTGRAPSMEYQYANAAERLYRETGDLRFREAALTWARTFQTLQPWTAWAYAMEAELTNGAAGRERALVKALFLDPLSPRLKAIPAGELQQAQAKLAKGNPFQMQQKPQPSRDATQTTKTSSSSAHVLGG